MLRLLLRGQHGVPVLCTAGLSGWAPCRLRRHGHSASIPHAFAPAALRALLASRGKPCGYPRRAALGAPRYRRTGLRRIGQASGYERSPASWPSVWLISTAVLHSSAPAILKMIASVAYARRARSCPCANARSRPGAPVILAQFRAPSAAHAPPRRRREPTRRHGWWSQPVGRAGRIASAWTEASSRSTIKTTLSLTHSQPRCFALLQKSTLQFLTKAPIHGITIVLLHKSPDAACHLHALADSCDLKETP